MRPTSLERSSTIEKNGFKKTYITLIYVSVFFIYYMLFLNQGLQHTGPLGGFVSETYNHMMMFSQPLLHRGWQQALATNFEPLFHILTAGLAKIFKVVSKNKELMNLANASAFLLASAKTAQFIIIKKIVDHSTKLTEARSLFLTTVINFCTVLYLPFITLNIYMPMITPNILIDPTNIFLAPFAILFFYLYVKFYIEKDATSYKKSLGLSLLLIAASLVKPAFTNIILVVIGAYYLFRPKRFASVNLFHDVLIYLPSCLILIWQLIVIQNSDAGGGVEFAPYKVIGLYTRHPVIALFQALIFPLLVGVLYLIKQKAHNSKHLHFAWLFCLIAYLIYALFSFSGPTWSAANLAWSYQIALTLLYTYSIIEYGNFLSLQKANPSNFLTNSCAIGFSLIFLSGIHQFVKIFLGGSYF
ncbi:MAG TPA: hypothetical protein VIJ14_02975 [Rhabdochlamydiaceae bacterium]